MAKYARGKKSYAISDRGGQRVPYTQLKTTWDGLRVAPDEWEPKHPQLTPARNIIDAEQLFQPRSTGQDREDVVIYLAHTFDPFVPSLERKSVGVAGLGSVGEINSDDIDILIIESGVAGTGAVGTEAIQIESNPASSGLGGTGAVGTVTKEGSITEVGVGGIANIGSLGRASYTPYTITVANAGSGNRYYLDGVLQQQLYLQEGSTYRFDQSDSTNSGHPLRFSTTSNGTHNSGSEYTTGVKTYGTPGSAGSYTEIQVATPVATLYYYCTNHSNMGGTAYTPSTGTISLAITVSNPGSGNKYYIDGGGPAPTISLTEGKTYRFDQSDSSNNSHPLRFSTTSGGSHGGGSEYTTGVTTNGTPGNSGAYTEITVASDAPTLYYYCSSHSGMGGQLNTPALVTVASVELSITEVGVAGTGAVGDIGGNATVNEAGVAGTGAVGNHGESNDEVVQISIPESGVAGTGAVGNETLLIPAWGVGTWSSGTWGN